MISMKDPAKLAIELKQFFQETGETTSTGIARLTGINQSQIHRNLYGNPKRVSKTLLAICEYAKISPRNETNAPQTSTILMEALSAVWDGSEEHAKRLAALLFAHHRAHM